MHNRAFLSTIQPAYPDWLVTVAFYVALHAVDALLTYDNVAGVTSHSARNETLLRTNKYLAVRKCYMPLYDLSQTVRYLADPTKWVPASEIEKNIINRLIYPIEKSVENLMKQDLKLPPIILAKPPEAQLPK